MGIVANDPDCKIELKIFHGEIINNHEALKKEQNSYQDIPVIRKIDTSVIQRNYIQMKQDIQNIIHSEMERLLSDPGMEYLVVRKR